jgi:hypothetical protein
MSATRGLLLLASGLLLPTASAQTYFEQFPVVGTPIPSWTSQVGTWTVTDLGGGDTRAHHTGTNHAYLTLNGSSASIGVVEALATGVSLTCNGGVLFRWDAALQNGIRAYGASSGGMNSYLVLILEAPGVTRASVTLPARTRNLRARLLAQGTEVRAQFDVEPLDGKWDRELSITVPATPPSPFGVYSWNSSYVDDFGVFDAAIFRRTTLGAPNLGLPVPLDLYAPTPSVPYALIASLTPGRVPLPNAWLLPVVPDILTALTPQLPTIFSGFSGTLDAAGHASATVIVPGAPALGGLAVFVTGVVLSGGSPPLLHLFNDERIDLNP